MNSLFDGTKQMDDIEKIYNQMEANCPNPCSTSKKLWELRRACDISSHNVSSETLLEKAVAMLAARGHMPEWFNQCPVASGITDSSMSRQDSKAVNKKSCVDLVHWDKANKFARLVELKWDSDDQPKWESNDPISALKQILGYGATYIFCLVRKGQLNFPATSLIKMNASHVSLEVVASRRFYNGYNEGGRFARISKDLNRFAGSKTGGTLTMSLKALAFPDGFQIPFADGGEVKQKCGAPSLTPEGKEIRSAFDNLTQVWP
ncbi:MAG: hypothetical protein OXB94_13435 [Nitrospira sp.]|nr:hypothetical protein [Nitrospira sp.]